MWLSHIQREYNSICVSIECLAECPLVLYGLVSEIGFATYLQQGIMQLYGKFYPNAQYNHREAGDSWQGARSNRAAAVMSAFYMRLL